MNIGHIQNGTHAGWRKVRMPHLPWLCPECQMVTNPGYRAQCKLCGHPRPKDS